MKKYISVKLKEYIKEKNLKNIELSHSKLIKKVMK